MFVLRRSQLETRFPLDKHAGKTHRIGERSVDLIVLQDVRKARAEAPSPIKDVGCPERVLGDCALLLVLDLGQPFPRVQAELQAVAASVPMTRQARTSSLDRKPVARPAALGRAGRQARSGSFMSFLSAMGWMLSYRRRLLAVAMLLDD